MSQTLELKTTEAKSYLYQFGKWVIAPTYAIGGGLITTVSTLTLPFVATLSLPWLVPIAIAVFIAQTAVSLFMFKDSVPDSLEALFTNSLFKDLSATQRFFLGLGIICALGGGLTLSALTYTSALTAVTFGMGLISMAFPPVGLIFAALLALVSFVAFGSFFIKVISSAIENDAHLEMSKFFKDIFTRDPKKIVAQQVLEGIFKLVFTLGVFAMSLVSTIITLGTMQKSLNVFLNLIPRANSLATEVASTAITYSLMGVARLYLVAQSACSIFAMVGEYVGNYLFQGGLLLCQKLGLCGESTAALKVALPEDRVSSLRTSAKVTALLLHGCNAGALAGNNVSSGQLSVCLSSGLVDAGVSAYALFYKRNPSRTVNQARVENPGLLTSAIISI